MILKNWENLPIEFQTEDVRPYYDILQKKKIALILKRIFDILASLILLVLFSWIFLILAIAIKIDSPGPIFFRQERVTQYGRVFKIFKFRTMVNNANTLGPSVTTSEDARITRIGKFIRKCRLDEISQLIDVLRGTMTFVGTRPEVPEYVNQYTPEMYATLLLPAGITSETSIVFKDESDIMRNSNNINDCYINEILPQKMHYNLQTLKETGLIYDIKIMLLTFLSVIGIKTTNKTQKPRNIEKETVTY